jgi:hypothetical protein
VFASPQAELLELVNCRALAWSEWREALYEYVETLCTGPPAAVAAPHPAGPWSGDVLAAILPPPPPYVEPLPAAGHALESKTLLTTWKFNSQLCIILVAVAAAVTVLWLRQR